MMLAHVRADIPRGPPVGLQPATFAFGPVLERGYLPTLSRIVVTGAPMLFSTAAKNSFEDGLGSGESSVGILLGAEGGIVGHVEVTAAFIVRHSNAILDSCQSISGQEEWVASLNPH